MASSDVTSGGSGHFREHMQENADMLGRWRWAYLALVVLSIVLMAVMFAAYAYLWPDF